MAKNTQAARPANPDPTGLRAVAATVTGPTGRKLAGNIGPGTLYPGAGKIVQRTGQPLRCGALTGQAFDVMEHPNAKDPARTSVRFVGNVIAVTHEGQVLRGAEWYLPPVVTRSLRASLKLSGGPVGFAVEIWCEPDAEGRPPSPLGYSYVSYDRTPARDNDPMLALAYESGILERPASQALAGPEQLADDIDPETGEVIAAKSAAA